MFRGNCEYPCKQSVYRIIGVWDKRINYDFMILLNKHNKAKTKKREDQPMKENKKLETSNTKVVAETL